MMARAVLLASLVVLLGVAAVPSASARPPVVGDCVVGASEADCLVSVQTRVCVTDPCDTLDVCLLYGLLCVA